MHLQNFFDSQRNALIQEFTNGMSTCLIATTPERLFRHADEYGWKLLSLQNSRPTSAQVVLKRSGVPELWVRSSYRGYRQAFVKYLQLFYNFQNQRIPAEWQVDHLQSTYRFKRTHPTYFIRLYLVDRKINASYGAGFEKMFYRSEREHFPNGGIHMDWIAFLKAYGEMLPSKRADQGEWAIWAWMLAARLADEGVEDKILAYAGISTVLNLGFTGRYAPLPLHESFKVEALRHPTIVCVPQLQEA